MVSPPFSSWTFHMTGKKVPQVRFCDLGKQPSNEEGYTVDCYLEKKSLKLDAVIWGNNPPTKKATPSIATYVHFSPFQTFDTLQFKIKATNEHVRLPAPNLKPEYLCATHSKPVFSQSLTRRTVLFA